MPRFRRTYSSREITATASAFSWNCISRVLSPSAPMILVVLVEKLTPTVSRPPLGRMPGAEDGESARPAASRHTIE